MKSILFALVYFRIEPVEVFGSSIRPTTSNYFNRFSGYDILPGYNCFDVFHNQHIRQDLEKYPTHLETLNPVG